MLCAVIAASRPAVAVSTDWKLATGTVGDWFDPANWTNGVPVSGKIANITNGGTASISAGSTYADGIDLSNANTSTLLQTGSTSSLGTSSIWIGSSAGTSGLYQIGGGTFTVGIYGLSLGRSGSGHMVQTDGNVNLNNDFLYIGYAATSTGLYELQGGALTATNKGVNYLNVGYNGQGGIIQTGGTAILTTMVLARNAGSTGRYELRGGQLTADSIWVGAGGTAAFVQNGCRLGLNQDLTVGDSGANLNTYDLGGDGTVTVHGREAVGNSGRGMFTQTSGLNDVKGQFYIGNGVGKQASTYQLSGGSLTVGMSEAIGNGGTGIFNQSDGQHTITTWLTIGRTAHRHDMVDYRRRQQPRASRRSRLRRLQPQRWHARSGPE
jgi:fibronectin-binding autotransporter adhesin